MPKRDERTIQRARGRTDTEGEAENKVEEETTERIEEREKDEEVECEKILNRQIEELRGRTRQIEGRYCESEREIEEDNE